MLQPSPHSSCWSSVPSIEEAPLAHGSLHCLIPLHCCSGLNIYDTAVKMCVYIFIYSKIYIYIHMHTYIRIPAFFACSCTCIQIRPAIRCHSRASSTNVWRGPKSISLPSLWSRRRPGPLVCHICVYTYIYIYIYSCVDTYVTCIHIRIMRSYM